MPHRFLLSTLLLAAAAKSQYVPWISEREPDERETRNKLGELEAFQGRGLTQVTIWASRVPFGWHTSISFGSPGARLGTRETHLFFDVNGIESNDDGMHVYKIENGVRDKPRKLIAVAILARNADEMINDVMWRLGDVYARDTYDRVSKNCNDFTKDAFEHLARKHAPFWHKNELGLRLGNWGQAYYERWRGSFRVDQYDTPPPQRNAGPPQECDGTYTVDNLIYLCWSSSGSFFEIVSKMFHPFHRVHNLPAKCLPPIRVPASMITNFCED